MVWKRAHLFRRKYITFSIPIEKEATRTDKKGKKSRNDDMIADMLSNKKT